MRQIYVGSPPGRIEGRVRGRIYSLHVLYSDDSIILCGRARTYYAKQLAQKAALDLPDQSLPLINKNRGRLTKVGSRRRAIHCVNSWPRFL